MLVIHHSRGLLRVSSSFDRLFGVAPGPPPDTRLERLYEAIRDLRASKTPSTWTEAERRLFELLPESSSP